MGRESGTEQVQPCSQARQPEDTMILTGLVAHTAQYGPDLDPEFLLSLLQALVHKIHNLVRGDIPSVWGEKEGGLQAKGRPWSTMELEQGGAALPLNYVFQGDPWT